jgi:hypothetical protein
MPPEFSAYRMLTGNACATSDRHDRRQFRRQARLRPPLRRGRFVHVFQRRQQGQFQGSESKRREDHGIDMSGARFDGTLDAESVQAGGDLSKYSEDDNKASFKDVKLNRAKITGQIDMTGAWRVSQCDRTCGGASIWAVSSAPGGRRARIGSSSRTIMLRPYVSRLIRAKRRVQRRKGQSSLYYCVPVVITRRPGWGVEVDARIRHHRVHSTKC